MSKSAYAVFRLQVGCSLLAAFSAGIWAGLDGAVSALLGGWINLSAAVAFVWATLAGAKASAGDTIRILIRGEAIKITLIVLQLWWVLTQYRDVVPLIFIATFIVTALASRLAFVVQDSETGPAWPRKKN